MRADHNLLNQSSGANSRSLLSLPAFLAFRRSTAARCKIGLCAFVLSHPVVEEGRSLNEACLFACRVCLNVIPFFISIIPFLESRPLFFSVVTNRVQTFKR
uniref:Uncharacterized protein n=1 Tax=Ixodes ricinus TaxID=34613 RepID=A0A6B0UEX4_IXORI